MFSHSAHAEYERTSVDDGRLRAEKVADRVGEVCPRHCPSHSEFDAVSCAASDTTAATGRLLSKSEKMRYRKAMAASSKASPHKEVSREVCPKEDIETLKDKHSQEVSLLQAKIDEMEKCLQQERQEKVAAVQKANKHEEQRDRAELLALIEHGKARTLRREQGVDSSDEEFALRQYESRSRSSSSDEDVESAAAEGTESEDEEGADNSDDSFDLQEQDEPGVHRRCVPESVGARVSERISSLSERVGAIETQVSTLQASVGSLIERDGDFTSEQRFLIEQLTVQVNGYEALLQMPEFATAADEANRHRLAGLLERARDACGFLADVPDAAGTKPITQWIRIFQRNLNSTVKESWPRLSGSILQHTTISSFSEYTGEAVNIVTYTSPVWKALTWEVRYSLMPPARNEAPDVIERGHLLNIAEAGHRGHCGVVFLSELEVDELRAASLSHSMIVDRLINLRTV